MVKWLRTVCVRDSSFTGLFVGKEEYSLSVNFLFSIFDELDFPTVYYFF